MSSVVDLLDFMVPIWFFFFAAVVVVVFLRKKKNIQ